MGYHEMENGLATVIKLLSGYSATNVAQGDYKILGHGNTFGIVLQPGAILKRDIVAAPRRLQVIWVVNIELYIGFTGLISTVATDLRDKRQSLLNHLDKYPTLNSLSGCINAFIREGVEPIELPGDPKRWWVQILKMYIEERTTITIAE